MDYYPEYIHKSRYARWCYDNNRREHLDETVDRYLDTMERRLLERNNYQISEKLKERCREYILELNVLPSMRALMTSGEASDRDEMAFYNCSYMEIDSIKQFCEAMYILTCGTGLGYSVEKRCVEKMPEVPNEIVYDSSKLIRVPDDRLGWCASLQVYMQYLYDGIIPEVDFSHIRKKGEVLRTFGGRASGPEALMKLFDFLKCLFTKGSYYHYKNNIYEINSVRPNVYKGLGRKLSTLECHDLMCFIASVIVSGGVRRSALIALFDFDDVEMRKCKSGAWYEKDLQRQLANNSAIFEERPTEEIFFEHWKDMYESFAGEPGLFNRYAVAEKMKKNGREARGRKAGTNPYMHVA